ncbi:MAG TPA: efflux RND transporter periplasmic adaptor subunit [Candidatus Magasanikbacteria bacterium]|nr:efflux RND transporter periplasmic adaptor subunit [Candidatus Magasanikbacteria bacterium]
MEQNSSGAVNTPIKKPFYRRRKFWIIAVIVVIVFWIGYGQYKKATAPPNYETVAVTLGTLKQTVDATGNVVSANELDLRFSSAGKLGKIYKNVNETVKAGEQIVALDLAEFNASVAQAAASVARADADLNRQLAGATEEHIKSLEARLAQAEASAVQVKANYDDLIANAIAAVDTAQNNLLMSSGGENSQIVQNSYDDMVAAIQSVQNTLTDSLVRADNILGIDNAFANDSFESALGALNTSVLNSARSKYAVAKASKFDLDSMAQGLGKTTSHEKIDLIQTVAEESLNDTRDLLYTVANLLNNTVPVSGLTQTELDTQKTNIQTGLTNLATKNSALLAAHQAIVSAKNTYEVNRIAYEKAKTNLDNLKLKQVADIASADAQVGEAEASLKDATNPPRDVDLASYRAAVSSARASLAQAVANRNKAIITAPVDGIVGKINPKIGEYVNVQDVAVKLVSQHFEVKVDIPETDIVKIAIGNVAEIKLDAYGDEAVFPGTVVRIEKGETVIQDVVYYNVTVSLTDDGKHQIMNGMTANIVFSTEERQGALYIPQRAVRTGDNGRYVRVLIGKEVKDMPVKTGLRGDGGMIEITEGLSEKDMVVLNAGV